MLPHDPDMLLSFVNTKLRDECASLNELCDELDIDERVIAERLEDAGYVYDEVSNQFKAVNQ